ncbi:MAG TPA: NAD(P)H-binding protein [Casimicrobiaceae bacterium]|nr:NAD(P)H-binding protein [Casimicrobiaceae bacterium]
MSRVFVIGVTGATGSRVARQLLERGDQVVGLHRRIEQAEPLRRQGIEPVHGDLSTISVERLAGTMKGADAVVFAAGASEDGNEVADAVDGQGMVLATAAAAVAIVRRFLHVSAFPDAWRDRGMSPEFEHYMKVKRRADVHLAGTNLEWVIVRPGTLTNVPGTGRVRLGLAIPYGEVPRDDLAEVLAELVHTPRIHRVILELTTGDTPIKEALI